VGPCARCRYADDGKPVRPGAAQGTSRADADERGLGTDADRLGGPRVCDHTQVRTARWAAAVWRAVHGGLAPPAHLEPDYRRRLAAPATPGQGGGLAMGQAPRGQWRQGLARLIESDAAGLHEQRALEPRITRLHQRMAPLAAQATPLADEAAWQAALRLLIGRLEDVAAHVTQGLDQADWRTRRELMRTLVTRVAVEHHPVKVVCRVDSDPFVSRPGKKRLQDCGGRAQPASGQYLPP